LAYRRIEAALKENCIAFADNMQPNLCRCGTHMRIMNAIRRAAGRVS
jgi:aerobic-type carbon monoxide dehydrogenase small subunit (CoxS/CutS family)